MSSKHATNKDKGEDSRGLTSPSPSLPKSQSKKQRGNPCDVPVRFLVHPTRGDVEQFFGQGSSSSATSSNGGGDEGAETALVPLEPESQAVEPDSQAEPEFQAEPISDAVEPGPKPDPQAIEPDSQAVEPDSQAVEPDSQVVPASQFERPESGSGSDEDSSRLHVNSPTMILGEISPINVEGFRSTSEGEESSGCSADKSMLQKAGAQKPKLSKA